MWLWIKDVRDSYSWWRLLKKNHSELASGARRIVDSDETLTFAFLLVYY